MIRYYNDSIAYRLRDKRRIARWVEAIARAEGYTAGDINYIFCSSEVHRKMNIDFVGHDYFTDIITFDYTEGDLISGDLFISLDTVKTNAEKFGTPYEEELHRVIIHGILHLCGIDDKGPGEREVMEQNENDALELLKEI
jgi:rRNA maturation RNase YbeY